jgi:hypothetical protein
MAIDRTKKISEFARISRASTDDLILLVNDPNGTPSTRTITIKNLYNDVGAEAIFYANTTFKANVAFQSNTLFTGNDNRFQSNVHFTSNVTIANTVTITGYGRTYSGGNPPIGNTEFQAFVANTNAFITTLQANGTFLLPNGAFAVANTTYNTDLANTNTRLLGLEAYGQLASNAHLIATYVSNTALQSFIANTNTRNAADETKVTTLETKMANQESLTANGFNVAFANAVSTATALANVDLTNTIVDVLDERYLADEFDAIFTIRPDLNPVVDGISVSIQQQEAFGTPSPAIIWTSLVNSNNKINLIGPGVTNAENQTLYFYKGFTYGFNMKTSNTISIQIKNMNGSLFTNGVYSNTVHRNNPIQTYYANSMNQTQFTVPMTQEANLHYADSSNAANYGTIVIR